MVVLPNPPHTHTKRHAREFSDITESKSHWCSQLLSCSKWFWSQGKINKRTPVDNLFSMIGNDPHQNYEFMLQDQVLL